jgi:hypothetical protein
MTLVPPDLVEFLESGVSILVGTRSETGRPEVARAVGAKVAPDRGALTVYLNERWAAKALSNLRATREIAVGFSRPWDNASFQLKGPCLEFLEPAQGERAVVERYQSIYSEQLSMIGFPRELSGRIHMWPAVGVSFSPRDLFTQTPGPRAGERLTTGAPR